jgi:hypothetical protein
MLKEYLSTLANAFRSMLETTEKINAQSFPDKVNEVYNAGYEKGKLEGGNTEEAYNNGFKAGKQAEWSEFWDSFQNYGNRTDYARAFGSASWNDTNFKPKYDIKTQSAYMMFSYSQITDLAQILKDCNVKLDLSQCTSITDAFSYGKITHIPELDLRSLTTINFGTYNSGSLRTIDKVILRDDGSQTFNTNLAPNSINLENITFEGTIGNSMVLTNKKLSVNSLLNMIEHLQDLNKVGKPTCTLTIGSTNLEKLTDEEKAIATQKGWTLA